MAIISTFTIGFSIIIAITLLVIYLFFITHINKSLKSIGWCASLLAALSLAQYYHFTFYDSATDPLSTVNYRFLILVIPSLFYFFSRAILFPDRKITLLQALHFLPLPIAFLLPREVVVPIAFIIGTAYCIWLTSIIYKLKSIRKGFELVYYIFVFFSINSVIVLIFGLFAAQNSVAYFYHFYTFGIGISFVIVTAILIVIPNILDEIDEVVRLGYATTTLSNLDINGSKAKLKELMISAKMYQNENLSLSILANEMKLSSHQLSELINTQFNVSFSHYIRQQRIEAAKLVLKIEPDASILSISMEVGFKSQSNFYAAFKEVTGESPGNYRKSPTS